MISTKGRYGLRVMIDLAQNDDGSYIPLKDIAERQEISKKYLEIIVKQMVEGGLIKGLSGKGGGYKLVKKPEKYTVGEIHLLGIRNMSVHTYAKGLDASDDKEAVPGCEDAADRILEIVKAVSQFPVIYYYKA